MVKISAEAYSTYGTLYIIYKYNNIHFLANVGNYS